MSNGRRTGRRALVIATVLTSFVVGLPPASATTAGAGPGATPPARSASSSGVSVSIGSVSIVGGSAGRRRMTFPVSLSQPPTSTVSVAFNTTGGTAKAGSSFRSAAGRLFFGVDKATGKVPLTRFVSVVVYPSSRSGLTRTFTVTLSHPLGVRIAKPVGIGRILGAAAGGSVRAAAGDMRVFGGFAGGLRNALVPITLSGPAPGAVTLSYSIVGMSAVPSTNYRAPSSGTLRLGTGSVGGWVRIRVVSGSTGSTPKSLALRLERASGSVIGRSTGTLTILPELPPLLFDDEFNGWGVDGSQWQPNWLGPSNASITDPVNGAEQSCYDPRQVVEPSDGFLHLVAVRRTCRSSNGGTYRYASGLVESRRHFSFRFGYLEARVWLPGGRATANWPAFWADGVGTWPSTGELDVMEGLSGQDCFHFHSSSGGPGGCASLPSPAGWHTFAARWSPGSVTFYYDGARVGRITDGVTSAPMYLILNLGVGGAGGRIVTPAQMLVDYVRVWR